MPRHLDSSLMDVDVHPTYVSIIIKSKVMNRNVVWCRVLSCGVGLGNE